MDDTMQAQPSAHPHLSTSLPMTEADVKRALREGIKEWLDEQFASFGKWTLVGLASAGMAALGYFILYTGTLHK